MWWCEYDVKGFTAKKSLARVLPKNTLHQPVRPWKKRVRVFMTFDRRSVVLGYHPAQICPFRHLLLRLRPYKPQVLHLNTLAVYKIHLTGALIEDFVTINLDYAHGACCAPIRKLIPFSKFTHAYYYLLSYLYTSKYIVKSSNYLKIFVTIICRWNRKETPKFMQPPIVFSCANLCHTSFIRIVPVMHSSETFSPFLYLRWVNSPHIRPANSVLQV